MATQAAAALLDELMGRTRNVLPEDRSQILSWDSPEVCRHYLVKFCPHDLFTNTKSDLGPCEKNIHDEELKREFDLSNSYRRTAFEDEFVRYAESMLTDVDKRIRKGKQRLALSVKEALESSTTGDGRVDEQLELLSERITGLVSEAERLGSEGNVEEAQGLLKLCDQLREERDTLRRSSENSVWHQVSNPLFAQAAEMAASQEKQMEVCEVCGAFLIVGDAQQRIDDHLTGKQHVGFAKLREAIQEIRDNREKARTEREELREKERQDRRKALLDEEKKKEKEKEDKRKKEEDKRRKSYEGDRDRRDRSRDRDRDRDRDRKDRRRSRSRDRRSSSSRDRSTYRSRDNDRRDRPRRSHSKDFERRRYREENGNY